MQKTDSERRAELVELYRSKLAVRSALAMKYAEEAKRLLDRFVDEDEKLEETLNRCVEEGEGLGLFAFQVTETFDPDQVEESFADFSDQLEDDARTLSRLRKEAEEADEEDERNEDDDEDDEDEYNEEE